jgi:nitrite reductase/ring-hydroxylating ferredoxin subunit
MIDNGWQRVASREEIKEGQMLQAQFGDEPIALTKIEGEIYAVSDTCPHEFALLSEGYLEGEEIECPLHQARFDVRTGRCLAGPATADLMRFEVKVEGDDVWVRPASPD